ncbi:MAG: hypothetical protein J3R72DRAFT_445127 [Linnemannia gamsii]|nr:hypothetical protein BGX24_003713 [Mortierella sp. AD032]KAK3841564.1 MAG: hypothetical protein J3R72DRAFT_445127 [Linnemannia gamsii]
MKIAILSLAVLAAVAMAAPGTPDVSDAPIQVLDAPEVFDASEAPEAAHSKFDGNSKCSISGFKPSFSKIEDCCLKNMGGSDFNKKKRSLKCKLPIGREGRMRKCVKDLGYATVVTCDY